MANDVAPRHADDADPLDSVEDARRMIVDAGGSLFDPKVVEVFNQEFDEILKVRRSHS